MKKWIKLVLIFFSGIFCGVISMSFLSIKASRTYLEMVRINYVQEEELLGHRALKDGELHKAFSHYYNVVRSTSKPGMQSFNPDHLRWSFDFPFGAVILDKILKRTAALEQGKAVDEGLNHGKVGLIYEMMGRHEDAQKEYLYATKLMGTNDVERTKQIVKSIMGK